MVIPQMVMLTVGAISSTALTAPRLGASSTSVQGSGPMGAAQQTSRPRGGSLAAPQRNSPSITLPSTSDKVTQEPPVQDAGRPIREWVAILISFATAIILVLHLRAFRSQTDTLSKELILTQRPKLRVRNVVLRMPTSTTGANTHGHFAPGEYVLGQLYVVNVGGTPAHVTAIGVWFEVIYDRLPMERPYEGKNPNNTINATLNGGESMPVPFHSEAPFDRGHFHTLTTGQGRSFDMYVMGFVEYRDDLLVLRRTAFCRIYRPNGFLKETNEDYEHEE